MDSNELEKRLEEAWVAYWSLDDSYFHVECSDEFRQEEKESILRDLQSDMDEISLEIEALEAEKDKMENGN